MLNISTDTDATLLMLHTVYTVLTAAAPPNNGNSLPGPAWSEQTPYSKIEFVS